MGLYYELSLPLTRHQTLSCSTRPASNNQLVRRFRHPSLGVVCLAKEAAIACALIGAKPEALNTAYDGAGLIASTAYRLLLAMPSLLGVAF